MQYLCVHHRIIMYANGEFRERENCLLFKDLQSRGKENLNLVKVVSLFQKSSKYYILYVISREVFSKKDGGR